MNGDSRHISPNQSYGIYATVTTGSGGGGYSPGLEITSGGPGPPSSGDVNSPPSSGDVNMVGSFVCNSEASPQNLNAGRPQGSALAQQNPLPRH
jgi:hypothetical protein